MILNYITTHTTHILRMNENCQTSDRFHGPNSHTRQPRIYRVPIVKEIIGFLVVINLENFAARTLRSSKKVIIVLELFEIKP